jgi:hypothetical protein
MVYIGAWGVPCSKKIKNGLKLLFQSVSERLGTIKCWVKGCRCTFWGTSHWLKGWSTDTRVVSKQTLILRLGANFCVVPSECSVKE